MANTRITQGVIKPNEDYDVRHINATGIVTAASVDVTNNLSIGGVLTYEDVTNVDSVGLITARKGIISSGVVTATAFHGSGASLTGIDATALKDTAGNVKVQAQASGAVHTGISTFDTVNVGSGVTIESNGQATFVGVVTFGPSSTKIDNNTINVGTALTLGHTQGVQFLTQNLHSRGFEVNQINASGIITASSFSGDGSNLTSLPAGLGTALSSTQSSPLNKIYYTNTVLPVESTITVDTPASASAAYTQYADISIGSGADLIISDGDDLIPDVLGLRPDGTFGGGALGRMRVDKLVGKDANSAVNVEKGLVVTGVTTVTTLDLNGDLDVDGHLNADNVSIAGVVTATSFTGSGANLTNLPAANLTGTLPAISGANLTDLNLDDIRRDIALLSLQTAVDTNRVAYNLQNSIVDQFEDSTGLSATTTVIRDSGEFIYAGTEAAQSAVSYSYDGSDDTYSPGAGVVYFIAHIWGAAGASGFNYSAGGGGGRSANTGGPGGYTTGKVNVTGSPSYIMSVGQGGFAGDNGNSYSGTYAFNGGGRGHCGTHYGVGGGGGGYSGIFLTSKTHGNSVMIAGGGAGAQSINSGGAPYYAGSGGGTTGQDGGQNSHSSHAGNTNGKGGTQSAGGAIGNGDYGTDTAGSALQGGDGGHMCGGGGGGYYGGGGADHKNNYGSSGSGGGSGYIGHASVSDASTSRTDMTTHAPSTIDPPGTGVSGYTGNAGRGISASNGNSGLIVIIPYTGTVSATGTAISKANTVTGARTKVSGVMLYKNAAGTNTLGTDLKVYFTCNGGSNWTEVGASDFSVGSDFSTGVKTVYLAEKTCTSGTDVRYKIEFANQSGSKKAEVYGMAINY